MIVKMTNRLLLLIFINLIFINCHEPSTSAEPSYEGPPTENIISTERAREMYDAYSQRRVPLIQKYEDSIASDSSNFTPTRYVEYDLKTIKQYIAYIEHEAMQANVDINTLRFYLSNYPNSDKFNNGDAVKYPKRNSFFVVPTMEHEGKNVGFSIEQIDGKYTAVPINRSNAVKEDQQDKTQSESSGDLNEAGFFASNNTAVQGDENSLILNDGTMVPPPGSDDFGDNN